MVSTNKETIGINDKSTSVITSWLNGNPQVFEIPNKSAFDGLVSSLFRSSSSVGGRPATSEEVSCVSPNFHLGSRNSVPQIFQILEIYIFCGISNILTLVIVSEV